MLVTTESKAQGWRAVAVFDDRGDALVFVGRSSTQVRQQYVEAFLEVLDEEEREAIYAEAKRLHITRQEVNILIDRAKQEHEAATKGHLPLEMMSKQPEVAFEQFRQGVANLRQIVAVAQIANVDRLFSDEARATAGEREIWRALAAGTTDSGQSANFEKKQ